MITETLLALSVASASPPVEKSVALLFKQTEDGGMAMACTATHALIGGTKLWLTAAHCVTEVDPKTGKDRVIDTPLFLSSDELNSKAYVRAEIMEVGKREHGYDYAFLRAPLDAPAIQLGDERQERNTVAVTNVAAPIGIGRVSFFGNVALRYIDRPVVDEETKINWRGSMLVSVPAEGGSSGSAIVSDETHCIIGVLVGHYRSLVVAVPASRIATPPAEEVLYTRAK